LADWEAQYFGGYEISVNTGRIPNRYTPQQLMDRWGEVPGERLKSNLEFLSPDAKATTP
jgi:hypothetical protein